MPGYKPISYSLRLGQSGICGRQRPQKCEKKGGGGVVTSVHMAITAMLAFPSILAILQSVGAQLSYTPP